ncbi:MAG: diguanylate cyclase [Pseudomonadota bacterium]
MIFSNNLTIDAARDLTQADLLDAFKRLHAQEEIFRTLAENVACMLWMTDPVGNPIFFNRYWLNFCGVSSEEAVGDWGAALHPDDKGRVTDSFVNAVSTRKEFQAEYRLRRHDGQYCSALATGVPRYDDKGQVVGYVGFTVDISEHKDNKDALIETHQEIERRSVEISLLNELNDNLQVCKNIQETQPILKRYGQRLFPEGTVSISLFNSSRNIVEPFVTWGPNKPIEHIFAPDDCWALRKGKIHNEFPGEEGLVCQNRVACQCSTYVCVPMMAYGEVIGSMNIDLSNVASEMNLEADDAKRKAISKLATMTADQVALALANLKLRATLHYQSTRDPLTQLFNRRYLAETLEREICRADRNKTEIGVMVLDIDHFKRFNDTYGHDAGDAILREFGLVLRTMFRESDVACRYGGEEFAIVVPEASPVDVLRRAEELRKRASTINVEHLNQTVGRITVSIGIANFPSTGKSFEELLSAADRALYEAKAEGRDRVIEAAADDNLLALNPNQEMEMSLGLLADKNSA